MTQLEKEIRGHVVNSIKDYIGEPIEDLHHNLFNTDYWVIGYAQAEEEILKHCSVFQAIGKIQEYENDNFGYVITDLSDAEKVCNMLVYILGEECLNRLIIVSKHYDERLTEEIANQIIADLS